MNEQEYKLIRNLAWDVLIDSKASCLPVNLAAIASLYKLNNPETSLPLYTKASQISSAILQTYGLYGNEKVEYFSVRVLAPITVLDALNTTSPMDVAHFTGLPMNLAIQRFNRLQTVRKRGTIGMTRQERIVLEQFQHWISLNYKKQ